MIDVQTSTVPPDVGGENASPLQGMPVTRGAPIPDRPVPTGPTAGDPIPPGPIPAPTETAVRGGRIVVDYVPPADVPPQTGGQQPGPQDNPNDPLNFGGPTTPATLPAPNVPTPAVGTATEDPLLTKVVDAFTGIFGGGGSTGASGGGGSVTVTPVPVDTGTTASTSPLKSLLVLAALGGVGYLGYRYYQKHHAGASA